MLASLFLLAQAGDALTYAGAVVTHPVLAEYEVNPLVRVAYEFFGPVGVVGLKMGIAIACVTLCAYAWDKRPRTTRALLVFGTALALVGAISNLSAWEVMT